MVQGLSLTSDACRRSILRCDSNHALRLGTDVKETGSEGIPDEALRHSCRGARARRSDGRLPGCSEPVAKRRGRERSTTDVRGRQVVWQRCVLALGEQPDVGHVQLGNALHNRRRRGRLGARQVPEAVTGTGHRGRFRARLKGVAGAKVVGGAAAPVAVGDLELVGTFTLGRLSMQRRFVRDFQKLLRIRSAGCTHVTGPNWHATRVGTPPQPRSAAWFEDQEAGLIEDMDTVLGLSLPSSAANYLRVILPKLQKFNAALNQARLCGTGRLWTRACRPARDRRAAGRADQAHHDGDVRLRPGHVHGVGHRRSRQYRGRRGTRRAGSDERRRGRHERPRGVLERRALDCAREARARGCRPGDQGGSPASRHVICGRPAQLINGIEERASDVERRASAWAARRPVRHTAGSFTGSGRITTVSATSRISSAGMPTRCACLRTASESLAW
jgi:hypothetical protein